MKLGETLIEDTFAEAFGMKYARLVLTAHDSHWLDAAVQAFTGYSSSVISCDAETGRECSLTPEQTPDGRVGCTLLAFGFSTDALAKAVANRVGQCLMTCPTTAVFDGLSGAEKRAPLGKSIRYFGDGYQKSKRLERTRLWRIPVMDGEFLVCDTIGVEQGVAGGNLILQATDLPTALDAARRGVDAALACPGVIAPFPGGVARSGSKVGSRYKGLRASTADAYCPTLKGRVATRLSDDAHCALEIVLDGVDEPAVATAMRAALQAIPGPGVVAVSAGNYGGKLGKHQFHLRQLLAG